MVELNIEKHWNVSQTASLLGVIELFHELFIHLDWDRIFQSFKFFLGEVSVNVFGFSVDRFFDLNFFWCILFLYWGCFLNVRLLYGLLWLVRALILLLRGFNCGFSDTTGVGTRAASPLAIILSNLHTHRGLFVLFRSLQLRLDCIFLCLQFQFLLQLFSFGLVSFFLIFLSLLSVNLLGGD